MRKFGSTFLGTLAWVVSATFLLAIFCGEIDAKPEPGKRRAASTQSAKRTTPRYTDVNRFVERREICDHFRGEDPYDLARDAFLEHEMSITCNGTDAQLNRLRRKYRDYPIIIRRLYHYDNQVE